MSKIYLSVITTVAAVFLYVFLAFLYGNNQYIGNEAREMLLNGFNIHYTQNITDFQKNSLFTWVISTPMRIVESVYSPLVFLIFLRLCSFGFLFLAIKEFVSKTTLAWVGVLYLLSPWLIYTTHFSYTSYLEFGAALYLLSAVKLRNKSDSSTIQFFWSFIHILAIGWCLESHYSGSILCFTSAFLILRRILKINFIGILIGTIVSVTAIVASFEQTMSNPEMYISHDFTDSYIGYGLVHVYPILKTILYWLRFGSTLGQNSLIVDTTFSWVSDSENIQNGAKVIWWIVGYALGTLTLFLSVIANYLAIKECKGKLFTISTPSKPKDNLYLITIIVFISTLLYSALAPSLQTSWELSIPFVFSLIPMFLFIDRYNTASIYSHLLAIVIFVGLVFSIDFMGAIESNKFGADANYYENANELINSFFN